MPTHDENKLRLQIPIIAEGVIWMAVLGNVQLGLRHPENTGPSAAVARQFADQLISKLHEEGLFSDEEVATIFRDEMRNSPHTVVKR